MRPPSLEQPPWTSHDPDGPSETTAVDLRSKYRSGIPIPSRPISAPLPPKWCCFCVYDFIFFWNPSFKTSVLNQCSMDFFHSFSLPPTLLLKPKWQLELEEILESASRMACKAFSWQGVQHNWSNASPTRVEDASGASLSKGSSSPVGCWWLSTNRHDM